MFIIISNNCDVQMSIKDLNKKINNKIFNNILMYYNK